MNQIFVSDLAHICKRNIKKTQWPGMRIFSFLTEFSFFSCPKFTQSYLFSARFFVFLSNFTHFFSFSDKFHFFSGKFIPMPVWPLLLKRLNIYFLFIEYKYCTLVLINDNYSSQNNHFKLIIFNRKHRIIIQEISSQKFRNVPWSICCYAPRNMRTHKAHPRFEWYIPINPSILR